MSICAKDLLGFFRDQKDAAFSFAVHRRDNIRERIGVDAAKASRCVQPYSTHSN
jgi:hypothetical protein